MTSIDADKAFDNTQQLFMIKNTQQMGYRRKLLQHNKSHIWKTPSNHHTQWWKTESFSSKIRNKTRMPAFTTSSQRSTGSSSQSNLARKINKRNLNWKRKSKMITVFAIIWKGNYDNNSIYNSVKKNKILRGFPGGAVVENLPANAGDTGSSPGLGRSHMPRSN